MNDSNYIWALALFTFLAVLGVALWQRMKVEKAKKEHHHTAMTEGRPDLRRTDGAPGVKKHEWSRVGQPLSPDRRGRRCSSPLSTQHPHSGTAVRRAMNRFERTPVRINVPG